MRVLFAGTPQVAAVALAAVAASDHEVVAVLTRPDAPSGRGRTSQRSAVAQLADQLGLPVLTPQRASDPALADALRQLAPECCPVVAYGHLLPSAILGIPTHGWVNLHFSLLPAWRGAAPVQWAILAGDEVTGATTFRIGPGLDDGPVFGSVTEPIGRDDTAGVLLERLAHLGSTLLVATLDAIAAGAARPVDQPGHGATTAPKITVDDARIRWSDPLIAIDRRIRATTPAPGAWTQLDDERLKVMPLRPVTDPGPAGLAPGEVAVVGHVAWVGTGTSPAALDQVRAAGRRQMAAVDWLRGLRRDRVEFR